MARSARAGVTLTEVLVTVAILAVVVGLLLPATRRVRVPAERMKCQNNLKQLILGLHNYESMDRPAAYPSTSAPAGTVEPPFPPGCVGPGTTPEERLSWMVPLLPYVEQESVYKPFDVGKGYADNLAAAQATVKLFLCRAGSPPADAVTHYVAMAGLGPDAAARPAGAAGNGFMGYDRRTSLATIKDGSSVTIALMETRSGLGPWARGGTSTLRGFDPTDVPLSGDGRPFGGHSNGFHAAMADGAVRYLRSSARPEQVAAAITIAAGDPAGLD